MRLNVDANIFASRYRETDENHAEAVAFFDLCEEPLVQFCAPVVLLPEVSGALSRIHGAARFGELAVTRILGLPRLKLRPIDFAFAERAARLAARFRLRGVDALYLTLAEENKSILVTRDKEILKAASVAEVITPAEWLAANR